MPHDREPAPSVFCLVTLGCKVNQYESQALRESWRRLGWRESDDPAEAGVILVNTCAVTANAVADVRGAVRRLNRLAPEAAIVLTGCAAEALPDELAALPGVARVVGQKNKHDLLPGPLAAEQPDADAMPVPGADERPAALFPPFTVSGYDRSRSVLKVQDGCSHGCTYCIVPLTRGSARSRPAGEVLDEARRLMEAGFGEIILSGVNLRQYRESGLPGKKGGDFWNLLEFLDTALAPEWAGRARLRISSLEPGQLGPKALDVLGACRLIAPHLHLSLQSGSPAVLERMGRGHYDPSELPSFLADLSDCWPVFGLGADLLTGFPGESGDEFLDTMALCRSLPLSYAHVFPYSPRPGTKAANMPGQVTADAKKKRAALLRTMVANKKQAFLRGLLKLPLVHVVFEDTRNGQASDKPSMPQGTCEFYADCLSLPDTPVTPRGITPARPVRLDREFLVVAPLTEKVTP